MSLVVHPFTKSGNVQYRICIHCFSCLQHPLFCQHMKSSVQGVIRFKNDRSLGLNDVEQGMNPLRFTEDAVVLSHHLQVKRPLFWVMQASLGSRSRCMPWTTSKAMKSTMRQV